MARSITLTLGTPLGETLGPNFNLSANYGTITPSTATKDELLAGKVVIVDDLAVGITITSTGYCTNSITGSIPCSPLSPIVSAFVTASGITGSAIFSVQTLYTELSGSNLFNKMYAIYPFVGANANSHRYNLVNTGSYTITFNGPWIHDSNGITNPGCANQYSTICAYANTGIIPNTFNKATSSFPGDEWVVSSSMHFYSRTNGASGVDMGSYSSGGGQSILIAKYTGSNSDSSIYQNTNNITGSFQQNATGLFGGTTLEIPSGSSGVYRNGVKLCGFVNFVPQTEPSSAPLYIGANNYILNPGAEEFTNRNYAFAAVGKGLTQNEMATLYTIVQNFEISLNRAV